MLGAHLNENPRALSVDRRKYNLKHKSTPAYVIAPCAMHARVITNCHEYSFREVSSRGPSSWVMTHECRIVLGRNKILSSLRMMCGTRQLSTALCSRFLWEEYFPWNMRWKVLVPILCSYIKFAIEFYEWNLIVYVFKFPTMLLTFK